MIVLNSRERPSTLLNVDGLSLLGIGLTDEDPPIEIFWEPIVLFLMLRN